MSKTLNVSIVLWKNNLSEVQIAIKYVLYNIDVDIANLFLIDNSPNDGLSILADIDHRICYIHTGKNLGYGSAHNIGINQSVKDNVAYHIIINPDIRLQNNVLKDLFFYMERHGSAGLVMPKVVYPDGKIQYLCKLLPTPLSLFSRRFLPKFISAKFDRKYNLLDLDYSKEMNVPLLSGCFMFLRVSAIKEVGMFDKRFFMYLEDFDFCRRIHKRYQTVFLPSVSITHEYAKGSYKNYNLMFYHVCSAIKYFSKWGWIFDKERSRVNTHFLNTHKMK